MRIPFFSPSPTPLPSQVETLPHLEERSLAPHTRAALQLAFDSLSHFYQNPERADLKKRVNAGASLLGIGAGLYMILPSHITRIAYKIFFPGSSPSSTIVQTTILILFVSATLQLIRGFYQDNTYRGHKKKVCTALALPIAGKILLSKHSYLPLRLFLPQSTMSLTAIKVISLILFVNGAKGLLQRQNREILTKKVMKNLITERGFNNLPPMMKSWVLLAFAVIKIIIPSIPLPTYYFSYAQKMQLVERLKKENVFSKMAVSALFTPEQKIACLKEGKFTLASLIILFLLAETCTFRGKVTRSMTENRLSLFSILRVPDTDPVWGLNPNTLNLHLLLPAYLLELKRELADRKYPNPLDPDRKTMKKPMFLNPCHHLVDENSLKDLLKDPKYSHEDPLCPECENPFSITRDEARNITPVVDIYQEGLEEIRELTTMESTPPFSLLRSIEELGELPSLVPETMVNIQEFSDTWKRFYDWMIGSNAR